MEKSIMLILGLCTFFVASCGGGSSDGSNSSDSGETTVPNDTSTDMTPSDNFDLSHWKITLPESQSGYFGTSSSSAAEILPGRNSSGSGCTGNGYSGDPLDDGFSDSDYFYTGSDGAMVFKTPLRGASTPNSSYIRSELRELYEWSPCGNDGAANWAPSGTHTLSATLKVVDYYDDDPQTVVGQIHAKESHRALVKLQWDGPSKDVRAIINEHPVDGNPFSLDFDLIPETNEWSYVIKLVDDVITISVTYNGQTETRSVEFGKDGMSADWNNHDYYFKAGNYAQAEAGNDGEFIVNFYSLNTSHD